MTIKKKIEPKVEEFIDRGGKTEGDKIDKDYHAVLVRVPISLMKQIENVMKEKPWINRSQWIMEAIYEKLNR